jgi:hypothetical protein
VEWPIVKITSLTVGGSASPEISDFAPSSLGKPRGFAEVRDLADFRVFLELGFIESSFAGHRRVL